MNFDFLKNKKIQSVFSMFEGTDEEIYVVGGVVRNELCGIKDDMSDIDFSTTATPEIVEKLLKEREIEFSANGRNFGTMTANIGGCRVDITTMREDLQGRTRFPKVKYTREMDKDARRRDFTINALYVSKDGRLFDFYHGLSDIRNRVVRYVAKPEVSVRADPLRILRYFRFCSLYFWDNLDYDSFDVSVKSFDKVFSLGMRRFLSEWEKMLEGPGARELLIKMDEYDVVKKVNRYIQDGRSAVQETGRLFWD